MPQVTLQPSGHGFPADTHETVLEAALRHGVCLPYGCRKVVLTSGENGYGIPELQAVLNEAVAEEDAE